MLRINSKKRIVISLCLAIGVLLSTLSGLIFTPPAHSKTGTAEEATDSQVSRPERDYRCVPRSAKAKPPERFSPKFQGTRKAKEPEYKALALRRLCPEGQVAVPASTSHFKPGVPKGNPLLGNIKDRQAWEKNPGEVIRRSLRPFKEVYWKVRSPNEKHHASLLVPDPACDGVAYFGSCYYYANAAFRREADGGGMTMSVERPDYVSGSAGGHTLNEIAIQGGAEDGHIVELGWNVSSDQYGDSNPHLFVFHWINWAPTCYDGCGWQQYSDTYFPGMNLNNVVGRQVYVGYVWYQGNWWAWFDNQWLGYFPGSEWGGDYTKSELIQWFGEVSSSNGVPPRTDMGNGRFPANPAAASMSTLCDVDAAAWVCWYRDQQSLGATVAAYYDIARTGFGATRYGGPGE